MSAETLVMMFVKCSWLVLVEGGVDVCLTGCGEESVLCSSGCTEDDAAAAAGTACEIVVRMSVNRWRRKLNGRAPLFQVIERHPEVLLQPLQLRIVSRDSHLREQETSKHGSITVSGINVLSNFSVCVNTKFLLCNILPGAICIWNDVYEIGAKTFWKNYLTQFSPCSTDNAIEVKKQKQ